MGFYFILYNNNLTKYNEQLQIDLLGHLSKSGLRKLIHVSTREIRSSSTTSKVNKTTYPTVMASENELNDTYNPDVYIFRHMDDMPVAVSAFVNLHIKTNKDSNMKRWSFETRVSNKNWNFQQKQPNHLAHGMNRDVCVVTGGPGEHSSIRNCVYWVNLRPLRDSSLTQGCCKTTNFHKSDTTNDLFLPGLNWMCKVNSGGPNVQDSEGNRARGLAGGHLVLMVPTQCWVKVWVVSELLKTTQIRREEVG